jgi:tyrosyl-tRNA synthetase
VLSGEEIDANARTYQDQAFRILRDDPELVELRLNSEWLNMSMEELFRLARTTTVAQVLEREDFANRWEARSPISILELLYPLMQGYDSVKVRADVELGGTDQTFNLLLARDIQRAYGQPEQSVLTMPILPGIDGVEKMSKSLGNHVGITEAPGEIYGRTLSLPDEAMDAWFALLAVQRPPAGTSPRDAKHALARALVERFHGAEAAASAAEEFARVHVQREVPEEIDELAVSAVNGSVHLPAAIAEGFGMSRSDARRMLAQGGVRLDGEPLAPEELDLPRERLDGAVLQVGKRHFRRLRVS